MKLLNPSMSALTVAYGLSVDCVVTSVKKVWIAHDKLIIFCRYYAIIYPIKAQYICTKSQARRVIITIWILSFTLAVPILMVQVMNKYMSADHFNPLLSRAKKMESLTTELDLCYYIEDITCFCVILNESVLIMHELRSSECVINTYEFNVSQKHVIFFLLHVSHLT